MNSAVESDCRNFVENALDLCFAGFHFLWPPLDTICLLDNSHIAQSGGPFQQFSSGNSPDFVQLGGKMVLPAALPFQVGVIEIRSNRKIFFRNCIFPNNFFEFTRTDIGLTCGRMGSSLFGGLLAGINSTPIYTIS